MIRMTTYTQRRNILKTIKLNVSSGEQFRDEMPTSGLFDMTDCSVLVSASLDTHVSDIALINTLLEGAINIIDFSVVIEPRFDIEVLIKSVPLKYAKNNLTT